MMESNRYSWATTPHKCDAPNDKGHYSNCDRGGTGAQNIIDALSSNGYGPGSDKTINTEQPFHVKVEFHESNGQFSSFSTTFTQGDNTQKMTSTESYLNNMTDDLKNNSAFVVSNWGGDASWLWRDRCSGDCNWPSLAIQNIKIVTGGAGPTPTPYDPNDFDFGDACKTGQDDDCAN